MGITRYAALLFVLMALPSTGYSSEVIKEGEKPPIFTLMDENGRMVNMEDILRMPTVIYFTHNACFYCTQIIAHLKRAETKFGKENIQIIGINAMAKDQRLIKSYKTELGFTFPMFAGNRSDLLKAYRINFVPVLVFVDSKKTVKKVVEHFILEDELHQYIREIIKNKKLKIKN